MSCRMTQGVCSDVGKISLAFALALPEALNEIAINKLVGIKIKGAVNQRR